MSFSDEIDSVVREASNMLGGSFVWNGTPYACAGSVQEEGRVLGEGGFYTGKTAMVNIALSLFTGETPQSQQTCVYNGVRYRIATTRRLLGGFIQLDLIDPTKGV